MATAVDDKHLRHDLPPGRLEASRLPGRRRQAALARDANRAAWPGRKGRLVPRAHHEPPIMFAMPKPPGIEGVDRFVGHGLPAIRIGDGPRTLVSLPGLSLDERHPTGQARTMALTGWEIAARSLHRPPDWSPHVSGWHDLPRDGRRRHHRDRRASATRRPDGDLDRRHHRAGDRGRAPRPGSPARARHQRDDGKPLRPRSWRAGHRRRPCRQVAAGIRDVPAHRARSGPSACSTARSAGCSAPVS